MLLRAREREARHTSDHAREVVQFWRCAGIKGNWFAKRPAFDKRFREAFYDLHFAAARRELDHWMDSDEGALGLMILLDQWPRNAFRGTAHMYATDHLALQFARRLVEDGVPARLSREMRLFCYLPFAHSENLADQEISVRLNESLGSWQGEHARGHRDIIRRFGRFPHRNPLLGRPTTPEERAFLDDGGFAG